MKKALSIFLAAAMVLSLGVALVGCSDPNQPWEDWLRDNGTAVVTLEDDFVAAKDAAAGDEAERVAAANTFLDAYRPLLTSLDRIDRGSLAPDGQREFDRQREFLLYAIEVAEDVIAGRR